MAAASSGFIGDEFKQYMQVDILPTLEGPHGCPPVDQGEGQSPNFVQLSDTREAVRRTCLKYLNEAGLPVHYAPSFGGMGSATGPTIETATKAAGLLFTIARGIVKLAAKSRKRQLQKHLVQYAIHISINKSINTLTPTLASLPGLIQKLDEDYPAIQIAVSIGATDLVEGPCSISFGQAAITDKTVLQVIDRLAVHNDSMTLFLGCRRRHGFEIRTNPLLAFWDGQKLWQFMNPDKKLAYPPLP